MVSNFVKLLESRYKGKLDQSADEYIGFITEGTTRLHALVDSILTFSGVDRCAQTVQDVDCNVILKSVIASLQVSIDECGADVVYDSLPTVRADPAQVGQLFQNLIANSLKFRASAPPVVAIEAFASEGEWQIEIRDNGIGLEDQYANKIFDMFQRLHTRQQYPGTGVGLAICKKIVEKWGGKIWVKSRPGSGASFFFTVPAGEPARVGEALEPRESASPAFPRGPELEIRSKPRNLGSSSFAEPSMPQGKY
jgi:light-regulated signal transduction histidine kinase (bacteriophytochrome)